MLARITKCKLIAGRRTAICLTAKKAHCASAGLIKTLTPPAGVKKTSTVAIASIICYASNKYKTDLGEKGFIHVANRITHKTVGDKVVTSSSSAAAESAHRQAGKLHERGMSKT